MRKIVFLIALMNMTFIQSSFSTEVQIQTVLGNINVTLFDEETPVTVDNFLLYVDSGTYSNTIIHRAVPEFIVQGGGFTVAIPPEQFDTNPAIANEPKYSNVRGTIAMAKFADDPNSARSQWFINLADNSANLDLQNGGFTVFGQVVGDGMAVVDAMAALPIYNQGGSFTSIPLVDYTDDDVNNNILAGEENLLIVTDIVVVDDTIDTFPQVQPALNTLINAPAPDPTPAPTPTPDNNGSGGGTMTLFALFLLIGMTLVRKAHRLPLRR